MAAPDDGCGTRSASRGPTAYYEALADTSRAMLAAAARGDADEIERLDRRCRELIAALKRAAPATALTAAEQRQRIEFLRTILAADAEIRERAEPWLRKLEQWIGKRAGAPGRRVPR